MQAAPIVRVAVEPIHVEDVPQLEAALKLLNQADPFVEVTVQESGEHVLGAAGAARRVPSAPSAACTCSVRVRVPTKVHPGPAHRWPHLSWRSHRVRRLHGKSGCAAPDRAGSAPSGHLRWAARACACAGEVHLETCIKDLRERFARVPLHVSAPLVAFRESVLHPEELTVPDLVVKAAKVGPWASTRVRAAAWQAWLPACRAYVVALPPLGLVWCMSTAAIPESWSGCCGARAPGAHPRRVQVIQGVTASGRCALRVRAQPLPATIAAMLDDAQELLRKALAGRQESEQVQHCPQALVSLLRGEPSWVSARLQLDVCTPAARPVLPHRTRELVD